MDYAELVDRRRRYGLNRPRSILHTPCFIVSVRPLGHMFMTRHSVSSSPTPGFFTTSTLPRAYGPAEQRSAFMQSICTTPIRTHTDMHVCSRGRGCALLDCGCAVNAAGSLPLYLLSDSIWAIILPFA